MKGITIPTISIPAISMPSIGVPWIGVPDSGKKGLAWPSGMKEAIKAIYDPAKQGMTNYDVIEAYAEDFTNWINTSGKYTGSLTSNSLILTNISQATALIYSSTKPYDFKVLITGLQEGQHIKFGFDYGETILEADKDGVYTIEWKDGLKGYGIYTNFVGECNITITQLPTSILKDLSGNGNHAYLYGGKGKLNSGMGVYQIDFTSYSKTSVVADVSHNTVKVVPAANNYLFVRYATTEMPAYTVNVQNLGNNVLTYQYATENGRREITLTEGINEIPESIKAENPYQVGFYVSAGTGEITITQIPDYPNQLCYDGKMYAVCYGFPILEDYTVMTDRTWFIEQLSNWTGVLSSNAYSGYTEERGFIFEYNAENNKVQNNSFGTNNLNTRHQNGISYMTKTSYNGNSINSGDLKGVDFLTIGAFVDKDTLKGSYNWKGCHGKIIIADRSFTKDEITWLKDNWKKI